MHRLLFQEAGQTLEHTPTRPVDGGAATYLIEDLTRPANASSERVLAEGDATVPDLVLTLDEAAGPREPAATKVPVESTLLAEAAWYWLEGGDGVGEAVRVDSLAEDDYLVARHPLIGSYAAGSTIRPLTISAPFPDEHAAVARFVEQEIPLRVVWRFSIEGRVHTEQAQIRVQRHVGVGDVAGADVLELVRDAWPDLVGRLPRAAKLDGWVRVSTRWVASKLRAKGIDPARFLVGDRGPELVAARFVLHAAHNGETTGNLRREDFLELAQAAWATTWQDLVIGDPGRDVADLNERDQAPAKTGRVGHAWTLEL